MRGNLELSPRQRQVADGIILGRANKQIRAHTGLSEKTIKNYIYHMFCKVCTPDGRDLQCRTELTFYLLLYKEFPLDVEELLKIYNSVPKYESLRRCHAK